MILLIYEGHIILITEWDFEQIVWILILEDHTVIYLSK